MCMCVQISLEARGITSPWSWRDRQMCMLGIELWFFDGVVLVREMSSHLSSQTRGPLTLCSFSLLYRRHIGDMTPS